MRRPGRRELEQARAKDEPEDRPRPGGADDRPGPGPAVEETAHAGNENRRDPRQAHPHLAEPLRLGRLVTAQGRREGVAREGHLLALRAEVRDLVSDLASVAE